MKTLRKVVALLLCAAMLFGLAACGGGNTPANGNNAAPVQPTVLKASSPAAPDAAWGLALQRMADAIKEKTGGRYQVDVYHKASLTENSEKAMTDAVFTGTLDICITPGSLAAGIWSAFSVPFQFDSREHIYKVLKSDIVADMCKQMEPKGMSVILHPTVLNDKLKSGIYWGESYLITEDGCECLMEGSRELFCTE